MSRVLGGGLVALMVLGCEISDAQESGLVALPIRVRSCPAADRAAGRSLPGVNADLRGSYRPDIDLSSVGGLLQRPAGRQGPIRRIGGTVMFPGRPPADTMQTTFQLDVAENEVRPPASARLTLVLDDSLQLRPGPTRFAREGSGMRPLGVITYIVRLQRGEFAALAGANRVTGAFGADSFVLRPSHVSTFRGMLVGAMCGWEYK
jgi:hypothetical protein